jgi:hypothetical protein
MFRFIVVLFFLVAPVLCIAQEFGANRANSKWHTIGNKQVQLIYPAAEDSIATGILSLIARINTVQDSSIGPKRKPVAIVLQSESTISNGYVTLAPWHSAFYLTSPTNPFELGTLNWNSQLALHEYRHVQQYSNYNTGLAKWMHLLLGEQGQAFANALTIPDWFFEGDAVFQETFRSAQGRGRTPAFNNGYRALWDAGIHYRFMKLRNGSLKNYVPDHYALGYQVVSYGREKFGETFWRNVTQNAAAARGIFYPFQKAVKQYSKLPYTNFINNSFDYNKSKLLNAENKITVLPGKVLNEENAVFTPNGALVYLKNDYASLPAFVYKNGNQLKKIRTRDQSLDHYFGYAKNKIVYASFRPSTRWAYVNYSELQLLNTDNGQQKRISFKTRYFTPSLSVTADSIIALQITTSGAQQLHLLKVNGQLLKAMPNNDHFSYFHPVFFKNNILVAAKNKEDKMTLLQIEPATGTAKILLPWSVNMLGYLSVTGDTVYFTSSYKGQDRLMAYDAINHQQFLLVSDSDNLSTGRYQPVVQGSKLVYARFTAGGYRLQQQDLHQMSWVPLAGAGTIGLADSVNSLTGFGNTQQYNVDRYPKTTKFFNFHSWLPLYQDPVFSFSLLGQNVLNTFQSELYAKYNRNEGYKQVGFAGLFGGFFPFVYGDFNYTFDRHAKINNQQVYWNQLQAGIGLKAPLNLSRGRSLSAINIAEELVWSKDYFKSAEALASFKSNYIYLNHHLRFYHQLQQAKQAFNPRFAQTLRINFRHTIQQYQSRQLMMTSAFYFPGLLANHSVVMQLAGQFRDSARGIRFSNDFPFARGYASDNFQKMMKLGINYQLPVCYPDAGLFNIVYLLRIRSNFFYDQAFVKDKQLLGKANFNLQRSFGNELFFDTRWWNQLPVSFGIRYARLLDKDIAGSAGFNRWQFVVPVNLLPGGLNTKHTLAF